MMTSTTITIANIIMNMTYENQSSSTLVERILDEMESGIVSVSPDMMNIMLNSTAASDLNWKVNSWSTSNYPDLSVGGDRTTEEPGLYLNDNELSESASTLPLEFTEMSTNSRNCVIVYCILFVLAAGGNLSVFLSVSHHLSRLKWRITVLILHLSVADLIVTFFVIPMEIFWIITVGWRGGDFLCKVCQFFRAFGLYLSSNILICISLDRFFAIIFPLRMVGATTRVKVMLWFAWIAAAISSAPQCFVFSVRRHPDYPSFQQCVTFGSFRSPLEEIMYNIFSVIAMYFAPLFVIIFTYGLILWKITQKSKEPQHQPVVSKRDRGDVSSLTSTSTSIDPSRMRRCCKVGSGAVTLMARAKQRTLRLTLVIVIVFVFCWTPYVVMTLWYMFDREGAEKVDKRIQDFLFLFAVSNSTFNPIIYGNYTRQSSKGGTRKCLRCGNKKRTSDMLPVTSVI